MRIVEDDRSAVVWLNYARKGDVDPTRPMGPNTMNEMLWPVEVIDKKKGGMRVGFSYIAPEDKS